MVEEELGGFAIQDLLGEGGMGMVYRAHDARLDRDVAVKVLHPALVASADGRARFRAEAKAVGRLAHPNIVQVYQWSEEGDERQFLVMEFLEGITLRDLLDRSHFSPPEALLCVAVPLTRALLHAHNNQVIHRDIKPGNVMVNTDGAVKLMDFGIARLGDGSQLTITGALVGSPSHMAPEVINGKRADERSDQFSLGTVLYEMASGASPFDAPNPAAIFRAVDKGEFVPLIRAAPALNSTLAEAIERLLARDPEDRYPTLQEFLDQLELVLPPWLGNLQRAAQLLMGHPQVTSAAWRDLQVARLEEATEDAVRHRRWPEAVALANRVVALDPERTELLQKVSGAAYRPWLRPALIVAALLTIGLTAASHFAVRSVSGADDAVIRGAKQPKTNRFRHRAIPTPKAAVGIADPSAGTAAQQTSAAASAAITYPVSIQVYPWAEVWLNGKRLRPGAPQHNLRLAAGEHRLELRHDLADPVIRVIRLPGSAVGGGQKLVTRIRRFRPALVTVISNQKGVLTTFDQRFAILRGTNELEVHLPDGRFRERGSLVYEARDCSRRMDLQLEAGGLRRWTVDCSSP
jgi:serine/threonine-protein kinase